LEPWDLKKRGLNATHVKRPEPAHFFLGP
jgi:hypothetical protein